jgi:hypothetical protein
MQQTLLKLKEEINGVRLVMVKLYKQIQFSDGYVFYEQKNGRYTDTKKEEDCDLSFDSWKDIQDALDNDDLEISICKLYK